MIKIANSSQMKNIDKFSEDELKIPSIVLMENAALSVVQEVEKLPDVSDVLIFAGTGNNGGDGFAVARHLYNRHKNVKVVVIGNLDNLTKDARTNLDILEKMGMDIINVGNGGLNVIGGYISNCQLIIDAIFGTGIKGVIRGIANDVIDMINASGKYVVSVDMPSGVDADTGKICGKAVNASLTVTFQTPKIGLMLHPGADMANKLVVKDIGIPDTAFDSQQIKMFACTSSDIKQCFKKRREDTHKGSYGKALIIAGSAGMTGAAYLSALSCLKTGAGLVYLAVPYSVLPILEMMAPEIVKIGYHRFDDLKDMLQKCDAAGIGPGIGQSDQSKEIVCETLRFCQKPLVIDADALNIISSNKDILKQIKSPYIVTPHPGEMSRLMNATISEIQEDRLGAVRKFFNDFGAITVLKGSRTLISAEEGIFVNTTGNPGMATAGSGDVLTGVIVSLLSQGVDCTDSAVYGVYLHGMAGDLAKEEFGEYGMTSGDIIKHIPKSIIKLQKLK